MKGDIFLNTHLSIIIPFKTDNGPRERAFTWMLNYYKEICPNADICIGTSNNPFNKAKAVNEAAAKAKGSIFAIIDADIICGPAALHEAAELLMRYPWIIPFKEVLNLSKVSTSRLLTTSPSWPLPSHMSFKKRSFNERALPVGGINIMKRECFEAVGGFDERFLGWGGEDDAFAAAMNTICGHYMRTDDTILHLWHPPVEPQDNEQYDDNVQLALRYCRAQGKAHRMRRILAERKKI